MGTETKLSVLLGVNHIKLKLDPDPHGANSRIMIHIIVPVKYR